MLATTLQPGQTTQCAGIQTSGAGDLVTGKARSGLRTMEAPAVSALPSSGVRSNLKSGIVRGGRSIALVWLAAEQAIPRANAARTQPQPVFVAQISDGAAKCIAGHINFIKGSTGPCIYGW